MKSRFKYTTVPKESFGLTEEEIYLLDDKQLGKIVSMKHLRPYRNMDENGNIIESDKSGKLNEHRIRKLKSAFKEELEQRKRLVKENEKANLEIQKETLAGSKSGLSKAESKLLKADKKSKNLKYALLAKRDKETSD